MAPPAPAPTPGHVLAPGAFHIGTGGLGSSAGNVLHGVMHSVLALPGVLLVHDWWLLLLLLPVLVFVVISRMGFR